MVVYRCYRSSLVVGAKERKVYHMDDKRRDGTCTWQVLHSGSLAPGVSFPTT